VVIEIRIQEGQAHFTLKKKGGVVIISVIYWVWYFYFDS